MFIELTERVVSRKQTPDRSEIKYLSVVEEELCKKMLVNLDLVTQCKPNTEFFRDAFPLGTLVYFATEGYVCVVEDYDTIKAIIRDKTESPPLQNLGKLKNG